MLDQLNSHLNNIAMATTNGEEVLAQLATNNTKLTTLTTSQFGCMEQLLKARPSTATAASNPVVLRSRSHNPTTRAIILDGRGRGDTRQVRP